MTTQLAQNTLCVPPIDRLSKNVVAIHYRSIRTDNDPTILSLVNNRARFGFR
jgi:hypothetical protein